VIFEDGYPSTIHSFLKRYHRWCRGDIQNLLFVMFSFKLPLRSRWKLLANCIRELSGPLAFAALFFCRANSGAVAAALGAVFADAFLPLVFSILDYLSSCRRMKVVLRYHSGKDNEFVAGLKMAFIDFLLFVPEAAAAADAYLRSLYRALFTKRKLLEWTTAEDAEKGGSPTLALLYSQRLSFVLTLLLLLTARSPVAAAFNLVFAIAPLYFWTINREAGSGTRGAFEELVMGKDTPLAKSVEQSSTGAVKSAVAADKNAIGYVSLTGLSDDVHAVTVNGVTAEAQTIKEGKYPIARPFLYVTKGAPSELAKKFYDYVESAEGQKIIKDEGLVLIK
jgi:hypothetical protein